MIHQYDAFISYRHLPADVAVAEKLQTLLEKRKKPDGTRITVFRDKSDLPTSGNLGSDIRQALESSRFLIIICSFGYQESAWCMEELRYFRQLHGDTNTNILPVLVEGEPDAVFPSLVRFENRSLLTGETAMVEVEPLGADVRGASLREQLKKLKTESLRIAAPILGVSFDDLFQRHHRRRQLVTAVIIAALALFCVYSMALFLQISDRQKQIEEKQRQLEDKQQEIYQKESIRLANEAISLVGTDNSLAMLIAKAALPGDPDNPEYPMTPEAELAIRSAVLQNMISKEQDYFHLRYQITFDTAQWQVGKFFADGKYLPVFDPVTVWLYETQTCRLITQLPRENTDYFFWEDQQTGVIWMVRQTWEQVGGQQVYAYSYGCINETGELIETPELPEEIQKVYEEQGIGIMNTEQSASMWSAIVGEYSSYEYEKMPPEYRKIWDYFCEMGLPNKPYAISMTDDRHLALIQFHDENFQASTAFWAVEEERLLWICPEACFWEENSGLIYRIMDTQLQVYAYQPENFAKPMGALGTDSASPKYDFVSEDGKYGFVRCTVDAEHYNGALVAYELTDPGEYLFKKDMLGKYQCQKLGNCLFWVHVQADLFAITPDGRFIAAVNSEGDLWIIDVERKNVTAIKELPAGTPMGVAISDDGSLAACAVRKEDQYIVEILDRDQKYTMDTLRVAKQGAAGESAVHLAINEGKLLMSMDSRACLYYLDTLEKEPLVIDYVNTLGFAAQWNWDVSFTDDGLLFIPSQEVAAQGLQKRIRGIVDLETGETVGFEAKNSYHREDFYYDDEGGYLIIRDANSFSVQKRNTSGDFQEVYSIAPRNVDMELVSAGHASDGTWLVLQNEQWCEIYRLADGVLCYLFRKSADHQFAVIDGCLWNFQAGMDQGIPLPAVMDARNYARECMKVGNFERILTDAECEHYYILEDWRRK